MNRPFVTKKKFETNTQSANGEFSHYCARLIAPENAAAVMSKELSPVKGSNASYWVLASDIPQPMFSTLESQSWNKCATGIRWIQSGHGLIYATLTIQVGSIQSRYVMSPFEPIVQRFLESVSKGDRLIISIGKANSDVALLTPCPIKKSELFWHREEIASLNLSDRQKAMTELPKLLYFLRSMELFSSMIKRVVLKEVSVSLLFSDAPVSQRHSPDVRGNADWHTAQAEVTT
jgi:hypothetical protein